MKGAKLSKTDTKKVNTDVRTSPSECAEFLEEVSKVNPKVRCHQKSSENEN